MSLVRTMSQEWGRHGIRVNAVAPDLIATPRVRASFEERGAAQQELAADASLQRLGEPAEVAGTLVFLVSELAGFVTGQTVIVDGGVHAALPHKMTPFSG
jgi:3-oxoacyl-[acyl-carrier protein] reductase